MVVRKIKVGKSSPPVLDYNQVKVADNVAVLVGAYNMDYEGEDSVERTFARRQRMNHNGKVLTFQLAISPGDGESWDDGKMEEYAARMMEGLGYGNQPYALYRHEDTGRTHWHVVASRVKDNGRLVDNYRDAYKCQVIAQNLQDEFGYRYGAHMAPRKNRFGVLEFSPDADDKTALMKELFNRALEYRFTSFSQFVKILRVHGLGVRERSGFHTTLVLQGLDHTGKPCTAEFTEKDLGMKLYDLYAARAKDSLKCFSQWKDNRTRIADWCREPLKHAVSQKQFRKFARQGKIDFELRRDPDSHRITGGDFIDHETKCAFKLSDFDRKSGLDLSAIREADEERWHQNEEHDSAPHVTLGDLLAGLSNGNSRSKEKDMRDDPRKKRRGRRL